MSDFWVGVLFYVGIPAAIIYRIFFYKAPPSSWANRKDVLNSDQTNLQAAGISANRDSGVFAGRNKQGSKIFTQVEDRACVIGPPGTGKTTFMVNQIYHWINSGNSFVCLDIKPELHEITRENLQKAGYECIVYNPTTQKDKYNFLDDLETPEAIGELASAFIDSESKDNAVFVETARDILDAIILHIKAPTKKNPKPEPKLPDVYDFLIQHDSMASVLDALGHSNSAECRAITKTIKVMADNERLLGSVFATFVSNMRFLRYESIRNSLGKDGFSLDVLQRKKVALFLQFEEAHKLTTAKLFSVMVGHLLRYMIVNYNRPPVLLLLDEIGNAGLVSDLTGKLNTIRSRNLPTWLYWQSIEQMQVYGKKADEGANIILGACDFNMVFRLNDNASAEWFSKKIGNQDVEYVGTSESFGGKNDTTTRTRTMAREAIIEPSQLQQLQPSQTLNIYRGCAWLGWATPYFKEVGE